MPDPRFFSVDQSLSLAEAATAIGYSHAAVNGQPVLRVASLKETDIRQAVVFCMDAASVDQIGNRQFGLCLTAPALAAALKHYAGAVWAVDNPKAAFAVLAGRLHRSLEEAGIAAPSETRPEYAQIDSSAVVSTGAKIGPGAVLGAHSYIGVGVEIGANTRIGEGVSVTHAIVGSDVQILPGARIGQAGFGFVENEGGLLKVPQLGRVIIGDNVEIGANTTIDRGALNDTVIGEETKIDNLVQIGHNVTIGRACLIASQTGISGSCRIGDNVMMGGQVGLADHLTIGEGAQISAKSGVMRDIPAGERWGGIPARPVKEWLREAAVLRKLTTNKTEKEK